MPMWLHCHRVQHFIHKERKGLNFFLNGRNKIIKKQKTILEMKKTNFLRAILGTLLFTMAVSAAVVSIADTNPMVTFAVTGLCVELVALMVSPLGNVIGADVYADTVLLSAQAFIKDASNKKFQTRPTYTKVMDVFMADREFTLPNLASLRSATTQATEALYLDQKTFTLNSTKSCSPTGETSGSSKATLSWNKNGFAIVRNSKQFFGNQVNEVAAFANDLWNAENTLWFGALGMDQALLDYLETNKSGVNNGGGGTFNVTDDIMCITNTNKSMFYNLVTADMQMNNYTPTFFDVHNSMWTADQRYYVNQGAGNSVNSAYQFDGFDFKASNLITPADYSTIGNNTFSSLHYIVPTGGVAILDWNEPLNRQGAVSGEKSWFTMPSMVFPQFTFDVFKTTTCADTTSSGGGPQDLVTTWEFTFNYALAKQPVPTSTETPIFKYGVMTDDTFTS